jgi:hypothetical protein
MKIFWIACLSFCSVLALADSSLNNEKLQTLFERGYKITLKISSSPKVKFAPGDPRGFLDVDADLSCHFFFKNPSSEWRTLEPDKEIDFIAIKTIDARSSSLQSSDSKVDGLRIFDFPSGSTVRDLQNKCGHTFEVRVLESPKQALEKALTTSCNV